MAEIARKYVSARPVPVASNASIAPVAAFTFLTVIVISLSGVCPLSSSPLITIVSPIEYDIPLTELVTEYTAPKRLTVHLAPEPLLSYLPVNAV